MDLSRARSKEVRRFVLPATWMTFEVDNRQGEGEASVLFSLVGGTWQAADWEGQTGFWIRQETAVTVDRQNRTVTLTNQSALAVSSQDARRLSPGEARRMFGVADANSALLFPVPKGAHKFITLTIAHYNGDQVANLDGSRFFYTSCYRDLAEVIESTARFYPAARQRCEVFDRRVARSGMNEHRQFLLGHAVRSYLANTALYQTADGEPVWSVAEGEYAYINTFDLAVDHVFLKLAMHPWTVRNHLDRFAARYHYRDTL
jgi:hypothetical protein